MLVKPTPSLAPFTVKKEIMKMLEKIKAELIAANAINWATDKKISFIIEAVTTSASPCDNRIALTKMLANTLLNEEPDLSDGDLWYLMSLLTRKGV